MLAIRTKTYTAGLAALCAFSGIMLFAAPAQSQLGPGDPRKIYPGAEIASRPKPPPNPSFTHGVRILPGGGYYGGPCYFPGYYGGYYGGYGYGGYYNSGFSVGFNAGGVSLGYNQLNGYNSYATVPPPVTYQYNYYGNGVPPTNYPSTVDRGARAGQQDDGQSSATTGRTPPPLKTGEDDANDYYLNRKASPLQKEPGLAQAVRDIETAFRNGDIRLIEKHLDREGMLTLMSMGRTRRQLAVSDYLDMTKDAFSSIKTVSYALDKVEPASGGAFMAYGKHVLKGENGADRTFNVSFVLKKTTDANGAERWLITEVSADPAK